MNFFLRLPLTVLVVALGSLSSSMAAEEVVRSGKPLLWKIEGKNLGKPSFLLAGTCPIPQEGFHQSVETAFTDSDLVMIMTPADEESKQRALPLVTRVDGTTLQESIGPALEQELAVEFKQVDPRLEPKQFNEMKTWLIGWILPSFKSYVMREESADIVFTERASAVGKPVQALSSLEEQLAFFNALPEKDQIALLRGEVTYLRNEREAGRDLSKRARDLYQAGDEAAILADADSSLAEALVEHPDLLVRLKKSVIDDCSILLSERISGSLAASPQKTHFIILPAGHILVKQGLRDRLTEAGYQITRINN